MHLMTRFVTPARGDTLGYWSSCVLLVPLLQIRATSRASAGTFRPALIFSSPSCSIHSKARNLSWGGIGYMHHLPAAEVRGRLVLELLCSKEAQSTMAWRAINAGEWESGVWDNYVLVMWAICLWSSFFSLARGICPTVNPLLSAGFQCY